MMMQRNFDIKKDAGISKVDLSTSNKFIKNILHLFTALGYLHINYNIPATLCDIPATKNGVASSSVRFILFAKLTILVL